MPISGADIAAVVFEAPFRLIGGFVYRVAFPAAQFAMREAAHQRGLPRIEDLNGLEAASRAARAIRRDT